MLGVGVSISLSPAGLIGNVPSYRLDVTTRRGGAVYIGAITFVIFALSQLASGQSTHYPWVFPGDFRERLRMSDIVLSGIIIHTSQAGTRTVNDTEVTSNIAHVRVDRIFQGTASIEELQFAWFSPHFEMGKQGAIYSGPPLAAFEPGKRYLIFLKPTDLGLEVAMPLYALEVELATGVPRTAERDLSQFPFQHRYESLAMELEAVALAQPPPAAGSTGMAATTFPAVFDLVGGCAEPFYRHFQSVSSPELRAAAVSWLELIQSRNLKCNTSVRPEKLQ
jgi:hypothetical protein